MTSVKVRAEKVVVEDQDVDDFRVERIKQCVGLVVTATDGGCPRSEPSLPGSTTPEPRRSHPGSHAQPIKTRLYREHSTGHDARPNSGHGSWWAPELRLP